MTGFSVLWAVLVVQASQPSLVVTISAAQVGRAPHLTIAREPVWRVGGEAEGPYSFTFIVGATFMQGGRVAVLEPKPPQVRVFDASGKHQFTFGRLGSGPGEFSMVQRLVPHAGDSLVVSQIARVSVFDHAGKHARTFATANDGVGLAIVYRLLGNGTMLATSRPMPTIERAMEAMKQPSGVRRDSTRIIVLSARGDSVVLDLGKRRSGEAVIVRHRDRVITAASRFSPGLLLEGTDSLILVSHTATGTIEIVSARSGHALRHIQLDVPRRALDTRNRAEYVRTAHMSEPVAKAMPYPDWLPVFESLRWSYDGVVRVRRFVAPLDSTAQWISVTTSGRILSVIDVPAKARVLDFDSDRVLLVERDADDLEYLALYKLIPSKR